MKPPKILYLEWEDHWTLNTPWLYSKKDAVGGDSYMIPEEMNPATCATVGFLVHEDKRAYYLSPFVSLDEPAAHKMQVCVIKACVTKKKYLKV